MGLAGCPTVRTPPKKDPTGTNAGSQSVMQKLADVDAITAEAQRVAARVRAREINKTQAADILGGFRAGRIGHNVIDDDVFETYRRITVQRESNKITQAESQSIMETKLKSWVQRWPVMQNRPDNPAFTNFLLKLYNLPMLGI